MHPEFAEYKDTVPALIPSPTRRLRSDTLAQASKHPNDSGVGMGFLALVQ